MIPTGKPSQTFGEPDEWEFDYTWEVVQTAFWLWAMSGFQRLPTQNEVMEYDPRYISDMRLAHQIYSHQGNQSAPMKLFEQWQAFNQNPDSYKASISALAPREDSNDGVSPDKLFNRGATGKGRMVNTGRKR